MKTASDFRKIAKDGMVNKWTIAVMAGLIASLLGGVGNERPKVNVNINMSDVNVDFNFAGQTIFSAGANGVHGEALISFVAGNLGFIIVAAFIMAIIYFVLGSFVGVGYAKFNLNLIDKKETAFETLFDYFSYWKTTASMRLFRTIHIFLWSLLFVIPGIVKGFSYAMTDYILAENPELTATEALELSENMMMGNRMRLFCLQFSFIGWDILATIPFGIGHLWLSPYKQASFAAFYREVSGTELYHERVEFDMD